MSIDVGVYFDLRNPHQWRQNPSRVYGFTLEVREKAERLGASSLWFSEHHLFDDDYLAGPLTVAAAVATCASRVRAATALLGVMFRRTISAAGQTPPPAPAQQQLVDALWTTLTMANQ